MSQQLIGRSPDLKRLRDEGFDIEVRGGYLLLKHVPHVNSERRVKFGILASELSLAGDVTARPGTHVAYLAGDYPCNKDGTPIERIRHQSETKRICDDLVVNHSFSSKPGNGYADFYEKMTTYIAILSSPAQSLDPSATARTFPAIEAEEAESVFRYIDTASSRAGIRALTQKLEIGKVAIVGLGGTGSYVLDLVAKTPVKEIHLFDADRFSQHNAFRSPGAASIEDLRKDFRKAGYFAEQYSRIHRHIIPHDCFLEAGNADQLQGMAFVFLCLDRGDAKKALVERMESLGTPFIDVGMGLHLVDEALLGVLRVTASTPQKRDHVREKKRIPFAEGDGDNVYSRNIQVADLNALNAALAVIKWKKIFGFYRDLEHEHHSAYTIDGNHLVNEDQT